MLQAVGTTLLGTDLVWGARLPSTYASMCLGSQNIHQVPTCTPAGACYPAPACVHQHCVLLLLRQPASLPPDWHSLATALVTGCRSLACAMTAQIRQTAWLFQLKHVLLEMHCAAPACLTGPWPRFGQATNMSCMVLSCNPAGGALFIALLKQSFWTTHSTYSSSSLYTGVPFWVLLSSDLGVFVSLSRPCASLHLGSLSSTRLV